MHQRMQKHTHTHTHTTTHTGKHTCALAHGTHADSLAPCNKSSMVQTRSAAAAHKAAAGSIHRIPDEVCT